MSHPRSRPSSYDSCYYWSSREDYRCQRRTSFSMDHPRNYDNNNNVPLSPTPTPRHFSKNTISRSPIPSSAAANILNEPLNQLNYGAGETRYQQLIRNSREIRQGYSGRFQQRNPPLLRRSSSENMLFMDPNRNPIFDEALDFVSYSRNLLDAKKTEICAKFVNEHFKCPVCLDVLIESTAVNCGHRFCRSCIENWMCQKPICPVCQKKVTICLPEFDIDNAINNVSRYLSDEWYYRRQYTLQLRTHSEPVMRSSSFLQAPDLLDKLDRVFSSCKRITRKGSHYLRKCSRRLARGTLWLHNRITLKDLVKGIIFGSVLAALWFAGDEFINFLQYSFYAITNFDKNAPVDKQIAAVQKKLAQVPGHALADANKPHFQNFKTSDDTVYAAFIRLFYNGWNFS